ncbi:MAG TPA: 3-dehydroquinate synthase, partial [Xanthobacteraceae bacterium]
IPFADADAEIEKAAGMSVPDIFSVRGEAEFRSGEARVIVRLLDNGPQVLATGGGAFINPDTRAAIASKGISIWLNAEFDILMKRIRRRHDRPLLRTGDPGETLRKLMQERYPVYALADLKVESRDVPHERIVDEIVSALARHLMTSAPAAAPQEETIPVTAPVRIGNPTVVEVGLGSRGYSLFIGRDELHSLGQRISLMRPGAKVAIVSDETVAGHYLPAAKAALAAAGLDATCITVPAGESSKSFAVLENVCEALLAARIERRDLVLALGGGVIGDLAGFAAAIVRRGLDYVQVPTTLLAQVDSSIGGKTAIDSRHGKNLIGAFHQPILVVSDTAVLDSLPEREFRAGYAEVAKYGLIGDADFFSWLESNWPEVFAGGPAREHAIAVSCRMKAAIVAQDEREAGQRALLNLGHTFGHALEAAAGFSGLLLHGEAISLGMTLAFEFSAKRELISVAEAERVKRHLASVGLPTDISSIPGGPQSAERLMELMMQDKKVNRGQLTLILARGIGASFIAAGVDADEVREFLEKKLSEP